MKDKVGAENQFKVFRVLYYLYYTLCLYLGLRLFSSLKFAMPRRPRPVSRRPLKNSISAKEKLKPRHLPPTPVVKLKSRLEEPSGSSSSSSVSEDEEDHLDVIERGDDDDDEEGADAPRISHWVDDDEDLYEHINDEPVRPSVHLTPLSISDVHVETS